VRIVSADPDDRPGGVARGRPQRRRPDRHRLQQNGFLLITGHGVAPELRAAVRAAGRRFFALPAEVKRRYTARIGGRGWLAPGVEANAGSAGIETPPDLKESFAVGPDTPTGDPAVDAVWFPPNVWPAEVPELQEVVERFLEEMRAVADDLLVLCAEALGQPRMPSPRWPPTRRSPSTSTGTRR
jgi:isopenicillin N synthase-like dioxygenase